MYISVESRQPKNLPAGESAQIRARGLHVVRGGRPILSHVDLTVSPRATIAVVGENGRGKSTLLKVLTGELTPDSGELGVHGTIGVADQSLSPDAERVADLVEVAIGPSKRALERLDAASAGLAGGAAGAEDEYSRALDAATRLDAWDAERRVDIALAGLGACADRDRRLETLSVGQRYRVRLACLLGGAYDFLLLDEPSNHLDAAALDFLTGALRSHAGGIVLISHDRALLAEVAQTFLDLDPSEDSRPRSYSGGYHAWHEGRARYREDWGQRHEAEQSEAARLAEAVDAARGRLNSGWRPEKGSPKHGRQSHAPGVVQSFRRAQERLDDHRVTLPPPPARLRWPEAETKPPAALRASGIVLGGRLPVPLEVQLGAGDRLLVTGPNGAGKSTLLSVLAGTLVPDAGTVARPGPGALGYLTQEDFGIPPGLTAADAFRRHTEELVSSGAVPESRLVGLGSMGLLDGAARGTRVGALSEGQRRRLQLAMCLATRPGVLILDEPTNHLSAALCEGMTEALRETGAAVVLATHDRQLLRDLDGWPRLELGGAAGKP